MNTWRTRALGFSSLAILLIQTFAVRTSGQNAAHVNSQPQDSALAAQVRSLNNGVLQLHGQMQQGNPSNAAGVRSQAATVIAQRAAALTALIQKDPHAAISFAFSPELLADLAAKFPQSASLLEANVTFTGQVEHWVEDSANLKASRSYFRMKIGSQTLSLYFAGPEPNLKPGEPLTANGVVLGSYMAVISASSALRSDLINVTGTPSSSSTPANPALGFRLPVSVALLVLVAVVLLATRSLAVDLRRGEVCTLVACKQCAIYVVALGLVLFGPSVTYAQGTCSTTGVQNVAVLLVTFPGVTLPTGVTQASLQDVFFAANTPGISLDGFLRDASYGQTSAAGAVFGPYTLTGSYASCSDVGGAVLNDAVAAAVASGVNLNNYTRLVLIFPDIFNCGWQGFANVGSCSQITPSGTFNLSVAYISAAYTMPRYSGVQLASHEMGHNLGLLHSGLITPAVATDVLGPLASVGTESDLGDYWSTMGQVDLGLYTSAQKAKVLGWSAPNVNYEVVQSSATFTLQPLETSPPGLQALKVQRGTGNNAWLWVEYRQPLGNYDSTLMTQPYSGALIHYEDSSTQSGHTYLPNFTPSDTTGFSAALGAGHTWTDPYTNLSLSVLSATPTGLTVSVNYGATPCTSSAPGISVSPLDPSIYPGQTASYSVSITNNDSSGCPSSTIDIGSSEPSGWSTSLSTSALTLGPGQSGSVTLGKNAPSGSPAGTYAVNLSASNASYAASGTANVTVMTPPVVAATVSVSGANFTPPGTVVITASVTNGGTAASGAGVTFTLKTPSGNTTTQTATTGSSGIATWNYKLNAKALVGSYSVFAQAALSTGSRKIVSTQTTTSNTTSFLVH